MKRMLAVLATLTLAGCGTYDFGGLVTYPRFTRDDQPARMVAQPRPVVPSSTEVHCRAVARQRGDDAAVNGVGDDLRRDIVNGTFSDCMDWANKHGS